MTRPGRPAVKPCALADSRTEPPAGQIQPVGAIWHADASKGINSICSYYPKRVRQILDSQKRRHEYKNTTSKRLGGPHPHPHPQWSRKLGSHRAPRAFYRATGLFFYRDDDEEMRTVAASVPNSKVLLKLNQVARPPRRFGSFSREEKIATTTRHQRYKRSFPASHLGPEQPATTAR